MAPATGGRLAKIGASETRIVRNTRLLGARTLLGAKGIATRSKNATRAPGLTTRSKDATSNKGLIKGP